MAKFTKTETIKGTYKGIGVRNGQFFDEATGEMIELAKELELVYGDMPFDLAITLKTDEELS